MNIHCYLTVDFFKIQIKMLFQIKIENNNTPDNVCTVTMFILLYVSVNITPCIIIRMPVQKNGSKVDAVQSVALDKQPR